MKTRIHDPYPFYYSSFKSVAVMAAIFTVAVFLFIYIIEPFSYNFDEHRFSFFVISLFNGVLVGIIFLVFILLLKITAPSSFRDETWTVAKEIVLWFSLLLLIGVANFFLRELIYDNPNNFSFQYLVTEIVNTYIIGSLFAVVAVMANYIHLIRSSGKKSLSWNELIKSTNHFKTDGTIMTITAPNPQDSLTFRKSDFLFANSNGNYVEFTIRKENGITNRQITRNTLANVEDQFQGCKNILRVHRSFIVNVKHVQSVKGNAQGLKLILSDTNTQVPVSRKYIPVFEAALSE